MGDTGMAEINGAKATLFACTTGLALGFSVVGVGTFGVFIPGLQKAFGWGRGEISFAHTIMSYTMALIAPLIGIAFDRWGGRAVLLPSIFGLGLVMAALSTIGDSLSTYYALYALLACLGAGTAPIGYMRTLALKFQESRGFAFGIALAGVGIGTAVIPPLVQWVIGRSDWRGGYLVVAGLVLFVSAPIAWAVLKEPQGDSTADGAKPSEGKPMSGFQFGEVVRRRTFWQVAVAFPILGVFTSGLMAHLTPMLIDRGIEAEAAVLGLSVLGIALIVGRLLTGWLLDRVFAPWLVAACIAVAMLGVLILLAGATGWTAFGAVALLGFAIGAELDFMSYLAASYFGTRAYAKIYGLIYGIFIAGSGIGPLLMGYGFDAAGNYNFALTVILGLLGVSLPLFMTLGRYPSFENDPLQGQAPAQTGEMP